MGLEQGFRAGKSVMKVGFRAQLEWRQVHGGGGQEAVLGSGRPLGI